MLFFSAFIGVFTLLIYIVYNSFPDVFYATGRISFFLTAFRTSTGEDLFDHFEGATYLELAMFVWFFLKVVGNMVLMNFFIAIVNQSYETCLCRYILMSFKIRVDFIV